MIQTDAMKRSGSIWRCSSGKARRPARYRVPTGDVEARVFARRVEDGSHGADRCSTSAPSGAHPRNPPTKTTHSTRPRPASPWSCGCPELIEAVAKAAGLDVAIREPRAAA